MIRILSIILILTTIGITVGDGQNRVVGYYPDWVSGSMPVEDLDFSILTHVNHAFAWPSESGAVQTYAGMLDFDLNVSIHENGGYILLCFGGWGNSDGFSPMTSSAETRQTFISNVIEICQFYEYDGVDFDWEHPANSTETNNYTLLIEELRAATDTTFNNFLITMAIPAGNWSGQHYDLSELATHVDWFNAMTYDYHGTWTNHAGHNAPLYSSPSNDPDGSCHTGINYLLNSRGLDSEQVNLGMAFYGKEFNASAINASSTGGNVTYQYNQLPAFLDQGWSYHWDDVAQVPYMQNPESTRLITYDDPNSIALKCDYAGERELGGVMIWALGQDYISGQEVLLEAIRPYVSTIDWTTEDAVLSKTSQLSHNFPNPFNPITTIEYMIHEPSDVSLTIYDARGRHIKTLVSAWQAKGNYQVRWDGTSHTGLQSGNGIYLAHLYAGEYSSVIKMVYIK